MNSLFKRDNFEIVEKTDPLAQVVPDVFLGKRKPPRPDGSGSSRRY